MRERANKRTKNLASVSQEKIEEDKQLFSGVLQVGRYYTKEDRKESKLVSAGVLWAFEQSKQNVKQGKYMYAVGPNGALYLGNPTVHSQFKEGKEVQSAGHISYSSNTLEIVIDNNSGHYSPSLSQFLSTIYGLSACRYLPEKFRIELNEKTKLDYSFDTSFFEAAMKKKETIDVFFDNKNNQLYFQATENITLSESEILENGNFPSLKKTVPKLGNFS